MPAVSAASDWIRWSRSWYDALRRARYSTPANAARVSARAPAYQAVSRPRSVCMSRLHDVADPAHRVDQLGFAPVVDLLAQPRDHDVHDVRTGVEMVVPGVLRDESPRHDPTLMAHQVLEPRVFFGSELEELPTAPYLAAPRVECQVRHLQHRRRDRLGAPPERLHPSEQLLQGERLCDVVVGAHLERLHLEIHGVLCREHQLRQVLAAIAQRAQHLEARHRRKTQVEHQQIVVAAGREAKLFSADPNQVCVEAGFGQAALHVLYDGLVVFSDEDLHPVGRYTLKFDPTPTCDSTSIRPRCSAMMP